MKRHVMGILTGLFILMGIGLMFYPFFVDVYNRFHQANVIQDYETKISEVLPETIEQERIKAELYNENLIGHVELTDPFEQDRTKEATDKYQSILNLDGSGVMGTVRIPTINVQLPIYHGTSAEVLDQGVGHLEQTSFPIGGVTTHAVLSAHTGSPRAEFFTNLDQVNQGDLFYIDILGETLAYRVDQIKVVLPTEIDDLLIEPDQDYITLVTCTPYGINSHRLLVRGVRTEYIETEEEETNWRDAVKSKRLMVTLLCLGVVAISIILFLIIRRKTKNL